jgi:polyphosphate kinase
VKIDLIVRGICSLRPGVPGMSENITVRSVVDRFLEHSRIYCFDNACQPEVYISSADWLPRNLFRRIEIAFPVEDGVLRERLISEILTISLGDTSRARVLQPNGKYRKVEASDPKETRRSQFEFVQLATKVEDSAASPDSKDGGKRHPRVVVIRREKKPGPR